MPGHCLCGTTALWALPERFPAFGGFACAPSNIAVYCIASTIVVPSVPMKQRPALLALRLSSCLAPHSSYGGTLLGHSGGGHGANAPSLRCTASV
jgi:hypothetical protein